MQLHAEHFLTELIILALLLFKSVPGEEVQPPSEERAESVAAQFSPSLRTVPGWAETAFPSDAPPEVCLYEATRVVGLETGFFEVRLTCAPVILDREAYGVARPPYGDTPLHPALSLTWAASVPGDEGGDRHEMLQVYVDREAPTRPLKLAVSVQEPRGPRFEQLELWRVFPRHVFFSWRAQGGLGERMLSWDPENAVLEDQIPLLVRALEFKPGERLELSVVSGFLGDRVGPPVPQPAELVCGRPRDAVAVTAGEFKSMQVREYKLTRADGVRTVYRVLETTPNVLLEMQTNDGRSLRLKRLPEEYTDTRTDTD
jgi:hypothetical protein